MAGTCEKIFMIFMCVALGLNSGCGHFQPVDSRTVEQPKNPAFQQQESKGLLIRSVVYIPSKLPLNDFFSRLRHGEFNEAFRKLDIRYHSSNTGNEATKQLIAAGFIPVYVEIKNTGSTPVSVNERSFVLDNGKLKVSALLSGDVPREFHSGGVAAGPKAKASVGDIAAAVVGMAALLAAFVIVMVPLAALCQGHCDFSGWQSSPKATGSGSPAHADSQEDSTAKDFARRTKIVYNSQLLADTRINPGESAQGLLLFHMDRQDGLEDYKLVVTPLTDVEGVAHLDRVGVLKRNSRDDVIHMKFEDARKACPAGSHLPTYQELKDRESQKFTPPSEEFSFNWFWSSTTVDREGNFAYIFDGLYGRILEREVIDINIAVWCLTN
jgi:hypothetical protein